MYTNTWVKNNSEMINYIIRYNYITSFSFCNPQRDLMRYGGTSSCALGFFRILLDGGMRNTLRAFRE